MSSSRQPWRDKCCFDSREVAHYARDCPGYGKMGILHIQHMWLGLRHPQSEMVLRVIGVVSKVLREGYRQVERVVDQVPSMKVDVVIFMKFLLGQRSSFRFSYCRYDTSLPSSSLFFI